MMPIPSGRFDATICNRAWPMTTHLFVEGVAHSHEDDRWFGVEGRAALALLTLVNVGDAGVVAPEASAFADDLAECCQRLRTACGLAVRTERERRLGGWFRRHTLETPVTIRFVADPAQESVAAVWGDNYGA